MWSYYVSPSKETRLIPPLKKSHKGSKFVSVFSRKIMNNKQLDELDAWKDFVLKVILEKDGVTLTDYVWGRLKKEFDLDLDGNDMNHYRYTSAVLPCLENEFQLIRTSGARGIQITEKGKRVAKIGFRSYINSLERHERVQKWNDYLKLITGGITIITGLFGVINMFIGLIDKITAFVPTALFVILFIAIKYFYNSK